MGEVEQYIRQKHWNYRPAGTDQFVVQVCPFCKSNDYHFYINRETGQYFCHHADCNQSGGFLTLKRHMGDVANVMTISGNLSQEKKELSSEQVQEILKAHDAIWDDVEALRYVHKRGFTEEAVRYFKLGVVQDFRGKWIVYPYFDGDTIRNAKLRLLSFTDKAFRRYVGGESILFNANVTKEPYDHVFVTEGEADCVALWSKGVHNVVSVPDGANSGASAIDALDKYSRIYLIPDTDEAGRKGLPRLARRLGYQRTYCVNLPLEVKDVNEYLLSHKKSDFMKLVDHAKQVDVEDVKSVSGIIQDIIISLSDTSKQDMGLHWPWKAVEDRLGGPMQAGDLYVVGGKPGVGKSYFAINVMMHLAKVGAPCLLFELEMRPERLTPRIVSHHLHMPTNDVMNMDIMYKAFRELQETPFYFAYKWKKPSWQVVEDTTKMCIQRYNIQLMVFDNLHFLCRKEERVEEVSMMIQNFKNLAVECAIPIIVIARPRKIGKKQIDSEDLAWSADIHGDADGIILIHRERIADRKEDIPSLDQTYDPRATILLDKARWGRGGQCTLIANDSIATFEDLEVV